MRFGPTGHALLLPEDLPDLSSADRAAELLAELGYGEEFCLSPSFEPAFIGTLMYAGFLVMSARIKGPSGPLWAALPKLHVSRSLLSFKDLHETRTGQRLAKRCELRQDEDFDRILDSCVRVHGVDWLSPPLLAAFRALRSRSAALNGLLAGLRMTSFALYRQGRLIAGEFGVLVGGAYTSYSGYRDEDSAGTVQLILTARQLRDTGYALWDLGMPMDYKTALGARTADRRAFLEAFRSARGSRPGPLPLPPGP